MSAKLFDGLQERPVPSRVDSEAPSPAERLPEHAGLWQRVQLDILRPGHRLGRGRAGCAQVEQRLTAAVPEMDTEPSDELAEDGDGVARLVRAQPPGGEQPGAGAVT